MPTIGIHHTKYWEVSDTSGPIVHVTGGGGYPAWQASNITGSLFGVVGAWIDEHWALLKWHWRLARRVHRLSVESRAVLLRTLDLMESPIYPVAQGAVRQTATTLGFAHSEAWKGLNREMKESPGRAENVFRHLYACRLLRETAGSTMTNPQQNFAVEVAYVGFTISRK